MSLNLITMGQNGLTLTQVTYLLYDESLRPRKRKSGRSLEIGILVANPSEKKVQMLTKTSYVFRFVRSFCTWHFLENMFKRCDV